MSDASSPRLRTRIRISPAVRGRLVEIEDRRLVDPSPHLLGNPVGILPSVGIEPAFLDFVTILIVAKCERLPQLHEAGAAQMVRDMWRREFRQFHGAEAEVPDHGIDGIQHRLRGTVARVDQEVPELQRELVLGAQLLGTLASQVAHAIEFFGPGTLEPIDCLLEVAHHEERAHAPVAFRSAREIFFDDVPHDVPLRRVRVLGFVDEHMVGALVELVTDPLPHSRLSQQLTGPADEIVEVGDACSALGAGVGIREGLPSAKAGSDVAG